MLKLAVPLVITGDFINGSLAPLPCTTKYWPLFANALYSVTDILRNPKSHSTTAPAGKFALVITVPTAGNAVSATFTSFSTTLNTLFAFLNILFYF